MVVDNLWKTFFALRMLFGIMNLYHYVIVEGGYMTKGFLLVDQCKNTIIIPYDDEDLVEFFSYKANGEWALDKAHTHRTLKELDADVRRFLKGEYEG
jgi:hypothetical protein